LFGGRKLSVDDQEGALKEGRLLGKLLNGVATVLEDSLVAVDVGDAGNAGDCVHVGGVVGPGHFALGIFNLAEVSAVDGAVGDLQLVVFA
jgi:hypothetical protein